MKRNVPIKSIMTVELSVVTPTHKPSDVRRLIAEKGIHHVPVVEGKRLIGLISATDVVRMSLSAYGADQRAVDAMLDAEFSIRDLMSTELTTLSVRATVREAAETLSPGAFHSVPVVDEEGNLVGLVTTTDLIRYLLDQY